MIKTKKRIARKTRKSIIANIMKDVVGQQKLKNQFNFHLKGYKKNGVFPSLLLNASMGEGKTMVLKSLAGELGKKTVVVNCASITNINVFVEDVYREHMDSDEPVTIIADEFHLKNILLYKL